MDERRVVIFPSIINYHLFYVLFLTDILFFRPNILLGYKLANGPDQVIEKNEININKTITKCRKQEVWLLSKLTKTHVKLETKNRNMQMQHT